MRELKRLRQEHPAPEGRARTKKIGFSAQALFKLDRLLDELQGGESLLTRWSRSTAIEAACEFLHVHLRGGEMTLSEFRPDTPSPGNYLRSALVGAQRPPLDHLRPSRIIKPGDDPAKVGRIFSTAGAKRKRKPGVKGFAQLDDERRAAEREARGLGPAKSLTEQDAERREALLADPQDFPDTTLDNQEAAG